MEVIVTHLTRMEYPNICVACIELGTWRNIRLVTSHQQPLTCAQTQENGGPFAVGSHLDVGPVVPHSAPPETEDHVVNPLRIKKVGQWDRKELIYLIGSIAQMKVASIFGPSLQKTGRTYASASGTGEVSLGFLRPVGVLELIVDTFEDRTKVTLKCRESGVQSFLAVTDLRLHKQEEGFPVDRHRAELLSSRLAEGVEALLSVGLTRPWMEKHWLQVNNIYLCE